MVATSSDPKLAAIRLAWWRERLEALDEPRTAPAEPRLQAVASDLLPRRITGRELSLLEDGWLPLLDDFPWDEPQADGMALRGRILFGVGARLLGAREEVAAGAGELWSLVDAAHHCSDPPSRQMLRARARDRLASFRAPMPRKVRVLTVLPALAGADLVREASGLKRLSAAVKHRLMGSFSR